MVGKGKKKKLQKSINALHEENKNLKKKIELLFKENQSLKNKAENEKGHYVSIEKKHDENSDVKQHQVFAQRQVLANRFMSVGITIASVIRFRRYRSGSFGSKLSLVSGLSAAYVYYSSAKILANIKSRYRNDVLHKACQKSFLTSIFLTIVMLYRFARNRKIVPTGFMVLVTALVSKLNYNGMTTCQHKVVDSVKKNETQSNQAQSNQAQSNQAQSNQAQSNQAQSNQAQSNQAQSNQAQSNQAQSNQAQSNQAQSNETNKVKESTSKYRCPECQSDFAKWNLCRSHLKATGHLSKVKQKQKKCSVPPSNYTCIICKVPGHWKEFCPELPSPTHDATLLPSQSCQQISIFQMVGFSLIAVMIGVAMYCQLRLYLSSPGVLSRNIVILKLMMIATILIIGLVTTKCIYTSILNGKKKKNKQKNRPRKIIKDRTQAVQMRIWKELPPENRPVAAHPIGGGKCNCSHCTIQRNATITINGITKPLLKQNFKTIDLWNRAHMGYLLRSGKYLHAMFEDQLAISKMDDNEVEKKQNKSCCQSIFHWIGWVRCFSKKTKRNNKKKRNNKNNKPWFQHCPCDHHSKEYINERIKSNERLDRHASQITMKNIHRAPCDYCHIFTALTLEHIVPASKGGSYSVNNFALICRRCQESRGNKAMLYWLNEDCNLLKYKKSLRTLSGKTTSDVDDWWSRMSNVYPPMKMTEQCNIIQKYFQVRGIHLHQC
jgi:uncharacterized membrane protein (UPF0136 family)